MGGFKSAMMRKKIKIFIVFMFLFLNGNTVVYGNTDLDIVAKSAILIEETTGNVLYSKNANVKMYPASLTKMLTATILLEHFDKDDVITVGFEINDIAWDSSKAGHFVGESILVENVIRALILPSGNDTANTVASAVAKKVTNNNNLPFSEAQVVFAKLMNEKAKELGALNSNFVNAHGYHDEDHYTTAFDMSLIAAEAIKNELIRNIVSETYFEGYGADSMNSEIRTQIYSWNTHNLLLRSREYTYEYATGIKTGFTNQAGHSLASSAEKDGKKLIAVVLFSPNPGRWEDTIALFDYGFENFSFQVVQLENEILTEEELVNVTLDDEKVLEIIAVDEFVDFLNNDDLEKVERTITYDEKYIFIDEEDPDKIFLKAPIEKGEVLGTVTYKLKGKTLFSGNVISSRGLVERTFQNDVIYYANRAREVGFSSQAAPFWFLALVLVVTIIRIIRAIKASRRRHLFRKRRVRRKY